MSMRDATLRRAYQAIKLRREGLGEAHYPRTDEVLHELDLLIHEVETDEEEQKKWRKP